MKYGYKFKFYRGYQFEKKLIFKEFVDNLYEIKCNSEKDSPDYIIAKLLLNSLYGRFGMSPYKDKHVIISSKEGEKYYKKYTVTNVIPLLNNKEIISYNEDDYEDKEDIDYKERINISVSIASAVTAYGRIHMSFYKMMCEELNITMFYSDTDSLYLDKELDTKFIGKELGKLKLEHIFKKAIFLSAKLYGGITENYETIKVKGLKKKIEFKDLIPLLNKNEKLIINQDK
jgi:DNA polymerase elongation subunit (family B)